MYPENFRYWQNNLKTIKITSHLTGTWRHTHTHTTIDNPVKHSWWTAVSFPVQISHFINPVKTSLSHTSRTGFPLIKPTCWPWVHKSTGTWHLPRSARTPTVHKAEFYIGNKRGFFFSSCLELRGGAWEEQVHEKKQTNLHGKEVFWQAGRRQSCCPWDWTAEVKLLSLLCVSSAQGEEGSTTQHQF